MIPCYIINGEGCGYRVLYPGGEERPGADLSEFEWLPIDPPGAVLAERARCVAIVRSTPIVSICWEEDAQLTLEDAAKRIESGEAVPCG